MGNKYYIYNPSDKDVSKIMGTLEKPDQQARENIIDTILYNVSYYVLIIVCCSPIIIFYFCIFSDGVFYRVVEFFVSNYATVLICILLLFFMFRFVKMYEKKVKNIEKEKNATEEELRLIREKGIREVDERRKSAEESIKRILNSTIPFKESSTMVADFECIYIEGAEKYLKHKKHPALKSAQVVADIKKKYKEVIADLKEMQYKYEFLLSTFPELCKYIDEEEGGIIQTEDSSDNEDHVRDYLSEEEYNAMSENERNQLALNRYSQERVSNRIAGYEYEMYVNYRLREKGFRTIDFGIQNGINDLGRDIIASKENRIYIIQCKRYSSSKYVHENTICQLYGTTIMYKIGRNYSSLFHEYERIIPVLYTTGKLSDIAEEFANKLGVKIIRAEIGEFPRIKCNINNNEKIYHLPFDQQYWGTKIEKEGECYAWTVEEAYNKGFRRARRWRGNDEARK